MTLGTYNAHQPSDGSARTSFSLNAPDAPLLVTIEMSIASRNDYTDGVTVTNSRSASCNLTPDSINGIRIYKMAKTISMGLISNIHSDP